MCLVVLSATAQPNLGNLSVRSTEHTRRRRAREVRERGAPLAPPYPLLWTCINGDVPSYRVVGVPFIGGCSLGCQNTSEEKMNRKQVT